MAPLTKSDDVPNDLVYEIRREVHDLLRTKCAARDVRTAAAAEGLLASDEVRREVEPLVQVLAAYAKEHQQN